MKLVFIANAPIPYHTPILNRLAGLVDLHVLYMSRDDRAYRFDDPWGETPDFEHSFHWSRTFAADARDVRVQWSVGVSRRLRKLAPDVVLVLSWHPITFEPVLWSRLAGCRSVMWSESVTFSGLLRGRFSEFLRRRHVGAVDAFVTIGSKATEYLTLLGAPSDRIVTSRLPSPPGVGSAEIHDTDAGDVRGSRFLFVGRLIPRKRPVELVERFARVTAHEPGATLTVVGDGLLRPDVEHAAAALGDARVRVLGRREGSALGELYAEADVLVLPAEREVWGLVVNEALAHGLFVIATDQVASAFDLLDEASGTIVPAGDLDGFAETMVEVARSKPHDLATRTSRAARVADCTPARFAADIARAAALAIESDRPKAAA